MEIISYFDFLPEVDLGSLVKSQTLRIWEAGWVDTLVELIEVYDAPTTLTRVWLSFCWIVLSHVTLPTVWTSSAFPDHAYPLLIESSRLNSAHIVLKATSKSTICAVGIFIPHLTRLITLQDFSRQDLRIYTNSRQYGRHSIQADEEEERRSNGEEHI